MNCGDAVLLGEAIGVLLLYRKEDLMSFDLVALFVEREHDRLPEPVVGAAKTLDPQDHLGKLPNPPSGDVHPSAEFGEKRGDE